MMNGGCVGMYPDSNTCMTVCNSFPTTVSGVNSYVVNSNLPINGIWQDNLPCRTYHGSAPSSTAAGGSPTVHCPHASITGGGACIASGDSTGCAAYCRLLLQACSAYPEVTGDTQSTCMTRCQGSGIKVLNQYLFTGSTATTGCSMDCRAYHLVAAINISASTHCPHTYINAAAATPCACASSTTGAPSSTTGAAPPTTGASGLTASFILFVVLLLALVFGK